MTTKLKTQSRIPETQSGNGEEPITSTLTKRSPKLEIKINAPNFQTLEFEIIGSSPLVVHRFSTKAKNEMIEKMMHPPKGGKKPTRTPLDPEAQYNEARYVSKDGWDGFNAAALRCAFISACRLVNFKMTIAKLSLFIHADGLDATESQYNLVRIYGDRTRLDAIGRLANGAPNPVYRPMYFPWRSLLRVSFDSDQLAGNDVANLLHRVGKQIGLCEGRYDSKNSAGQGWGCFTIGQMPPELAG